MCKRIARRLDELAVGDAAVYRSYLADHPEEWEVLDALCHVTISRFCRDRGVFRFLADGVLPELARVALARGSDALAVWSAGCASGEEPYTLALVWELELAPRFPGLGARIVATDVDEAVLRRAAEGCYPASSLSELPQEWRSRGFFERDGLFCLRPELRHHVTIGRHDVRDDPPAGAPFDLVLCRNVAFTYFDVPLQLDVVRRLAAAVLEGGALVLGSHEALPPEAAGFEPWSELHRVYRRVP